MPRLLLNRDGETIVSLVCKTIADHGRPMTSPELFTLLESAIPTSNSQLSDPQNSFTIRLTKLTQRRNPTLVKMPGVGYWPSAEGPLTLAHLELSKPWSQNVCVTREKLGWEIRLALRNAGQALPLVPLFGALQKRNIAPRAIEARASGERTMNLLFHSQLDILAAWLKRLPAFHLSDQEVVSLAHPHAAAA